MLGLLEVIQMSRPRPLGRAEAGDEDVAVVGINRGDAVRTEREQLGDRGTAENTLYLLPVIQLPSFNR